MKTLIQLAVWTMLFSSCATVKMVRVSEEWKTTPQGPVKRLLTVVQPVPEQKEKVGELIGLLTRRYVNQKRNFLVKGNQAQAEAVDLQTVCAQGIEGILWVQPNWVRVKSGLEGNVLARLLRCGDGKELWAAEAGGSFPSFDERLVEVTKQYQAELGDEVEPYVAPAMNVLRPLLDTLPNPTLTDDEVSEKIELGE